MNSELLVSTSMWIPAHGLNKTKGEVFDIFQYLNAAAIYLQHILSLDDVLKMYFV